MTDWFEQARLFFSQTPTRGTAKTAKTPISAVMAVPHLDTSRKKETLAEGENTSETLVSRGKNAEPGITADDVLRIFPGSKVIQLPHRCEHCSASKELKDAPAWRRHGKIVERTWLDGRREWACSYCGRAVKQS